MSVKKFDILGVKVSAIDLEHAVSVICHMIRDKQKGYICVAPVSTIVDCQKDPSYRDVINRASLVTPDGMPVVWLAKSKGLKEVSRAYGPDLMNKLCLEEEGRGIRHFFYGGSNKVCDTLERNLRKKNPDIIIAGKLSPAFTAKADIASKNVLDSINAARPDILWVALGSPKQDFWLALNRPFLDVPVMVGVGAAFDFLAGEKPHAPKWIQRSGLEWLFRLCCEPRRLWKRYLVGNSLFIWWLLLGSIKEIFEPIKILLRSDAAAQRKIKGIEST